MFMMEEKDTLCDSDKAGQSPHCSFGFIVRKSQRMAFRLAAIVRLEGEVYISTIILSSNNVHQLICSVSYIPATL